MKGRICRLQLLVVLTSAVILGFESHGTREHILLSQIRDFPFRHLLRLAGFGSSYVASGRLTENAFHSNIEGNVTQRHAGFQESCLHGNVCH
jgi:hypothetical protein